MEDVAYGLVVHALRSIIGDEVNSSTTAASCVE